MKKTTIFNSIANTGKLFIAILIISGAYNPAFSQTWNQLGIDIDGEASLDYSGVSVSLSADGSRLAIGAPWNDGNGSEAGHVRVYQLISGQWTQQGADIDGEAAGDYSGHSVSLSADGSRLAIGATYNDGNGLAAGHVRVYSSATVGIIENGFGKALLLYPNPTSSSFSIALGEIYQTVKVSIRDMNGKLVFNNTYGQTQLINIEINEPAGIYLLTVESGTKKAVLRIVKE